MHTSADAVRLSGSTHDHYRVDRGLTTLTPEEYDATAPGKATRALVKFMLSAVMIAVGSELGGIATNALGVIAELRARINPSDERLAHAVEHNDRQHQAGMRKGLLVIGAWSAFEGWVEDFTKGLMQTDPNRFYGKQFGKRTIASTDLATDDDRDDVWRSIENSLRKLKHPQTNRTLHGIDRYEQLFAALDLPGDVLGGTALDLKPPFTNAFQIRNVWAHNAGYADANFIDRSIGLGFTVAAACRSEV